MQYFNTILILLAVVNRVNGKSGDFANKVLELLTKTAPKLMETLSKNHLIFDEVPGSFLKHVGQVQAFGNNINNLNFNGAQYRVHGQFDSFFTFQDASATPNNLIDLQNFVARATVVGYSAYQIYELQKRTELIIHIVDKLCQLGSLVEDNSKGLKEKECHYQDVIRNIKLLSFFNLLIINDKIKEVQISAELHYWKEVDVLFQNVAEVKKIMADAEDAVLEDLKQAITKLTNIAKNKLCDDYAKAGCVLGLGVMSLISYAAWANFPIILPFGAVATICSELYKMKEIDVGSDLKELHGLLTRVENHKMELNRHEVIMDNIVSKLKLWQAQISIRYLQILEDQELQKLKDKELQTLKDQELQALKDQELQALKDQELQTLKDKERDGMKPEAKESKTESNWLLAAMLTMSIAILLAFLSWKN